MKALFAKIKKKSKYILKQGDLAMIQIAKDLIARRNQDGNVIVMRLDESSLFYKIDGIAAQVWGDLVDKKTADELVAKYQDLYPENKDDIQKDISNFIQMLFEKKLVVEV